MRDPLSIFLHEKAAAEAAPYDLDAPNYVTKNPDPKSLDPGERAMAGVLAVGGSLAAKVVPWMINVHLRGKSQKGSFAWPQGGPMTGSSISDIAQRMENPSTKLLGLWDVGARRSAPKTVEEAAKRFEAGGELNKMRDVVDSFINEHGLTEKGVRLHLSGGPLSKWQGPHYNITNKTVHLPRVSKEYALHELGHAADYTTTLGKIRGIAEPLLSRGVMTALPVALIAGDRIKEFLPGTVDDHVINFMQDHAPAIMGATLAATSLYPELKASALAIQHIKEVEGHEAARVALRKLAPAFGTYLMGAIPAVVGMALARKYLRQARAEKQDVINSQERPEDLQKVGGAWSSIKSGVRDAGTFIADAARDAGHIGKQIYQQSGEMIQQPGVAKRVAHAAREVGTSPEFVYGALSAAIPATMGALYLYSTEGGKQLRGRMHPEWRDRRFGLPASADHDEETWREKHPLRFAGLVAAGATLSGGVLSKLFADLGKVL